MVVAVRASAGRRMAGFVTVTTKVCNSNNIRKTAREARRKDVRAKVGKTDSVTFLPDPVRSE